MAQFRTVILSAPRLTYTSSKIVGVVVGSLGWSNVRVVDIIAMVMSSNPKEIPIFCVIF